VTFEAQVQDDRSSFYAMKLDGSDSPRDRIRGAVVELVAARGCEETTLEMVLDRAGVSLEVFQREFESIEEAGIAAYDEMTTHYVESVRAAFRQASGLWRDKLRAAAYTAARSMRDNSVDVRFGAVELIRANKLARAHRDVMLEPFVDMIDLGRHLADPHRGLTRSTAEATIGSILDAVRRQAIARDATDPFAHVPKLMYVAVRPYLGLRAAEEELAIPPPREGG
jgi:AcrR family transcriptional regulator